MKKSYFLFFIVGIIVLFYSCGQSDYDFSKRAPTSQKGIYPFWLEAQKNEQMSKATSYPLFHDFTFQDSRQKSGILFKHHITDDSGKNFKANHYDHGNGVVIADINNDGFYDIYFISQIGPNELWKNLGNGQFENITVQAGLSNTDLGTGVTASFADIDNDGDPDLYATFVKTGNMLFQNDGKGNFIDISETSGLNYRGHSSGATFFDYDRDGLLDLFLSNIGTYTTDEIDTMVVDGTKYNYFVGVKDGFGGHLKPERTERSILYKNLGNNRFLDVSESTGLVDTAWTGDAFPLDANADGWTDLFVLNMQGHDEYYENIAGKHFKKKSRALFPKTSWGSMSAKYFDFDNDGQLDIFITDMHSDMSERIPPEKEKLKSNMQWPESFLQSGGQSIFGNAFFKQTTPGSFQEISDQIGAENYWPWGLSTGDINADGFEDVFITCSMNYPYRYRSNILLLNNRGEQFLNSEFILGVEPRKDSLYAQPWFTIDCSGAEKGHKECKGQEGEVVFWSALGSRSSVIFDLDNDGDLDIVTNEFNNFPMVLVSNLSEQKTNLKYLKIKLTGTTSNRNGLGAQVKLTADGKSITKVMDGKSGYLSQSVYPLYFGLADAKTIEKVEIFWPSGHVQILEGPFELNSMIEIVETKNSN
ncbi:MAG: hypothetical protein ACI8P3_000247 [Saprospiraceae bacterium]|jgi:hypothetical protein